MGLRPSCASRASRRCCCWCCRSIRAGLWVERHGVGAYGQSTRFHKQTIMATTRVLLILLSTHAPPAAARPPARLRSIACRAACHNGCVCDRIVINLPSHHVVWWALVGYCCCCIAAPALLPAPPGLLRSWWSEAATIDRTHHCISVPGAPPPGAPHSIGGYAPPVSSLRNPSHNRCTHRTGRRRLARRRWIRTRGVSWCGLLLHQQRALACGFDRY